MSGQTLSDLLVRARQKLSEGGIGDATREARILIGGILRLDPAAFISAGGRKVSVEEAMQIEEALLRRLDREPVHRILGRRDFFGLTLSLSPDTLEPRPDTEILVERMIPVAQKVVAAKGRCGILDLGTGTGAICLALIDAVPGVFGVGTDISPGALETARRNAQLNGMSDRFEALESDWFAAVEGRFDIIVSNPPYIRTAVIDVLDDEVKRFDPRRALDGGEDGLDAYREIARAAGQHLEPAGTIGLEIGFDQKQTVTEIMVAQGFGLVEAAGDLAGNDRVLVFSGR